MRLLVCKLSSPSFSVTPFPIPFEVSKGSKGSTRQYESIFDKLTDSSTYTGMYAVRNVPPNTSSNRRNVKKKGTGHAQSFSEVSILAHPRPIMLT